MARMYGLKKVGKYWHAEFRVNGIYVHKSTKCMNRSDALAVAAEWYREAALGSLGFTASPKTVRTLRDVWEEWRKLKGPQVSELHVVNMRCAVETHAVPFADRPIDQLDNAVIEELRAHYLSTKGRGYRTGQGWEAERAHTEGGANALVKMLSSLCGWAVEMGYIEERPFKVKKLKAQEKAKPILWPEQVQAFLAAADSGGKAWASKEPRQIPQSATAMRLMIGLGLREDEALAAKWDWVDWRRRVFVVKKAKDRAIREIPLPSYLVEHLQSLHAKAGKPTIGLILVAGIDAKTGAEVPRFKNYTQKPVARCGSAIGVPGLTPHSLRHTFATGHFEAGTPLSQIQQMLGHEAPSTTMGYIQQRPKDQAEAQERLSILMGLSSSQKTRNSLINYL